MSNIESVLREAAGRLRIAGIEGARLDAEVLLAHFLGISRPDLLLESGRKVDASTITQFDALIDRRLTREPVARITGTKEFWSLDFRVDAATLVPRPDSETLIEAVLEFTKTSGTDSKRILD